MLLFRHSLKLLCTGVTLVVFLTSADCAAPPGTPGARTLSVDRYRDGVRGWWMGKIIGVNVGGPYEFTMPWPPHEVSTYDPATLALGYCRDNDDLYVPLVFLLALEKVGPSVTQEQIAREFLARLERQRLWCANYRALLNLEAGIAPPLTGHPVFNDYSWAIDAQMQSDIWGVLAPGMAETACGLADRAARITNYADGVYGGIFTAALASAAFFERDIPTLVGGALGTIPAECGYAAAARDVIEWHRQSPSDWRATREKIRERWEAGAGTGEVSAVLNGASVVMALLYSGGDFDRGIVIATMAGWDTDCNAATVGGIIGIMKGGRAIPARWNIFNDRYLNESVRGLPRWMNISDLIRRTVAAGEAVILHAGGRKEGGVYLLPPARPVPPGPAQKPFPVSPGEKAEWATLRGEKLALDLKLWNPALSLNGCRADGTTGLRREFQGKRCVFATAPASPGEPCVLAFDGVSPAGAGEEVWVEAAASRGEVSGNRCDLSVAVNGRTLKTVRMAGSVPPEFQVPTLVPRRGEDIVLYVARDGTTYHDEGLTQLAQASDGYDPSAKPEPLCVSTAQNNVTLFRYPGKCPPGKSSGEIRSYFIMTEWVDSPFPLLYLSPGDPYPYGIYWPKEYVPDLPLPPARPIRLRIIAEEELPSIPEGGKLVLMHDGDRATVISLPRISTAPSPWFRLRVDLAPHLAAPSRVEIASTGAEGRGGEAFWEYARIVRRPRVTSVSGTREGK